MRSDNFLINAFIALSLLMTTGFISVAQTPVETHGGLRVEGNQIVGEHGRPVQLMGMSHYWSLADLSESSAALNSGASVSGGSGNRPLPFRETVTEQNNRDKQ